ncbi:hypothetical protein PGTUg99_035345 [Puccinia graminis f. sp. tritici]|uniref:Hydrophobin n=1 Tax=Puccinia graminis f. sp. tritici TaxID=56615 RepID=A0A5B0SKK0_PUCGR|nr:hypothetical protein PGTUg99_035345 [Puccinia graminis f. sp. tritici]
MHVIKSIFSLLTLKFALVSTCDESKFRHACGHNYLGVSRETLRAIEGACGKDESSLCCDKTKLRPGETKTGAAAVDAVPCHFQ